MGGVLALEVAQQMLLRGDDVRMLLMFDTMGPNYMAIPGRSTASVLDRLRGRGQDRSVLDVLSNALSSRAGGFLREARCRLRLARRLPLGHEHRHWYVERVNLRAVQRYVPRVYRGRIHLIRGSMEETGLYSDPERGWSGWAEAGVVAVGVEGKHGSLIESPGFGSCLRELLDSAAY